MPRLTRTTPRLCRDRKQAYTRINGQRVQLGTWGTDDAREAYDRLIAEWLSAGRKLPTRTAEDEPATVTDVTLAYWRHAKRRYDARDLAHIKPALRFARRLYGSQPAEAFGPKRLRIVREQMIGKGWSRRVINRRINWLRAAFRWAASHELCSEGIHRRLTTVPGLRHGEGGRETERVKPVPRPHIRRVRPHLSRPVRALIALQLLTAARADELVRLTATDIDTSGDVWTFTPAMHKTAHRDKERVIYFGPRAQRVLRCFMRPGRPLDRPLFSPREAYAEMRGRGAKRGRRPNQKPTARRGKGRWRNQHAQGQSDPNRTIAEHYCTASYRRAIHRAADKAFPPPADLHGAEREAWRKSHRWGPHRLRHNAATFLRREYGIDVASVILGHSTLAVTQTYAEVNRQKAVEVIGKVG